MNMERHQEEGLVSHRESSPRHQAGFWSSDPFTPSIARTIQNSKATKNVRNMDDVGLPSRSRRPSRRFSGQSEGPTGPVYSFSSPQNNGYWNQPGSSGGPIGPVHSLSTPQNNGYWNQPGPFDTPPGPRSWPSALYPTQPQGYPYQSPEPFIPPIGSPDHTLAPYLPTAPSIPPWYRQPPDEQSQSVHSAASAASDNQSPSRGRRLTRISESRSSRSRSNERRPHRQPSDIVDEVLQSQWEDQVAPVTVPLGVVPVTMTPESPRHSDIDPLSQQQPTIITPHPGVPPPDTHSVVPPPPGAIPMSSSPPPPSPPEMIEASDSISSKRTPQHWGAAAPETNSSRSRSRSSSRNFSRRSPRRESPPGSHSPSHEQYLPVIPYQSVTKAQSERSHSSHSFSPLHSLFESEIPPSHVPSSTMIIPATNPQPIAVSVRGSSRSPSPKNEHRRPSRSRSDRSRRSTSSERRHIPVFIPQIPSSKQAYAVMPHPSDISQVLPLLSVQPQAPVATTRSEASSSPRWGYGWSPYHPSRTPSREESALDAIPAQPTMTHNHSPPARQNTIPAPISSPVMPPSHLLKSTSTLSSPDPQPEPASTNVPVQTQDYVRVFIKDTLLKQLYLHLLLRLPYIYFSRVDRIFRDAKLTIEEIKEMALKVTAEDTQAFHDNMQSEGYYSLPDTTLPRTYQRLKDRWEYFIDNVMREWKTLNIISVLLLSAIMTMFQIQGAANDPVTRYLAFWSLVCALMSLLYGCLFIVRFGTMRKASKAAEWALEAQNSQTILWNVWVMLSMPCVWLAWSILTFTACIMSFMWRSQANPPPDLTFPPRPSTEFAFRIFICVVLGIGIFYGGRIIFTFRRYGVRMDEAWQDRVQKFIDESNAQSAPFPLPESLPPPLPQSMPLALPQSIPSPPPHYASYSIPMQPYFPDQPAAEQVPKGSNSKSSESSLKSQAPDVAAASGPIKFGDPYWTVNQAEPRESRDMQTTLEPNRSAPHSPDFSLTFPALLYNSRRRSLVSQRSSRSKSPISIRGVHGPQTSVSRRTPSINSIDVPQLPVLVPNQDRSPSLTRSHRRYSTDLTPPLDSVDHLPELNIPGEPLLVTPLPSGEPEEALSPETGQPLVPASAITSSTEQDLRE